VGICPIANSQTRFLSQGVNQIRELQPNQTIEREMTGAETHRYDVTLKTNEFFQVRVEQKGVDVALKLLDVDGKELATMDSPNGKEGPETLSFVAEKARSVILEVSGFDAKAKRGFYTIKRQASRQGDANDKRRVVTERLFVEGIQARETRGQTESAIRKLKEALTGWEELKDEYLTELTARQIKQITLLPPDIVVAFRGFYEANGKAQTKLKEAQELMDRSRADALLAREKANDALAELRALGSRVIDKAIIEKTSSLNNENLSDALQELRVLTKVGEANCLSAIGQTHYILGEWQAKLDYSKQMISINRQLLADEFFRNSTRLSPNYFILKVSQAHEFVAAGQMLQTLGKLDEAVEYFNLALERSRTLFQETQSPNFKLDKSLFNSRQDEALVLFELGKIYGRTSKYKSRAIESLSKAVEIYKLIDQKREAANGLFLIGDLFASEFNFEAALKNVDEALKNFEELNDKSGQFKVLELKGIVYFWLNDKTKSKGFLDRGIEILQSPGFNENDKKNRFSDLRRGFWRERIDDAIERERLEGIATAYKFQEDFRRSNEKVKLSGRLWIQLL
jgi:tetratricopeptide (TPR) repeat protein